MKAGSTKYSREGDVEFAEYGNRQTAIIVCSASGERLYVATVNLEGLGAPGPGPNQVWLKTWSENAGVDTAMVSGGICTPTGVTFNPNHDAIAVLADLTPAAIAERAAQRAAA